MAIGKGLRGKMSFEQTINGLSTKKPTNQQQQQQTNKQKNFMELSEWHSKEEL